MVDKKDGRPCAVAFAVAMALGLSACGGGGGSNVRPSPPPPPAGGSGFAGGEIDVGAGDTLVWPQDIGGSIDLIKVGAGTLVLAGTDSYGGGTTISEGTLQIGNGGTTGSITGDVTDNAFLVFNRSDDLTFKGLVSGSGSLEQAGKGTLILTGTNTYTGETTISRGVLQLGNGGSTGSIVGDVTNNGSLVFDRSDDVTFKGIVSGSGSLEQAGKGTLILTGANTYSGGTTISRGILQIGNGGTTGSITGDVTDNGFLVFNRSDDLTFKGLVSGSGALEQAGKGTLTLTGASTYTGGTTISRGVLQLGNGGTTGSVVGDVANSGSLVFNRSDDLTFKGLVSGSGSLEQAGMGILTLTGANTYSGGTTISRGVLQLGNGGTTGSVVGDVANSGSLVFNRSNNVIFDGIVSGSGSLEQAGSGTLILTGANTYTGGTLISHGVLQLGNGGTAGAILGDVADNGLLVFNRRDDMTFSGIVSGSGSLVQAGNGTLTLTGLNTYTGDTRVNTGSLYVDGDQSAATGTTAIANGAALGGMGTLGGDVTVADGATLTPGSNGATGTLTIKGDLSLSAGSTLDYTFGQANTVGGPLNDLTNINGDLVLDGTLNVSVAAGGSFGPGIYRVFNYTGTLTNNGLAQGSIPSSSVIVQTVVAHQVNLINADGMAFSFWDGNAGPKNNQAINGGSGTWESGNSLTSDNWTDANGAANAPFGDRSFAVFQAAPGAVTVSDGNGDINVAGMQFASDGYHIQGDTIHLVGIASDPMHSIIRVGDGTTAGAGYFATINSVLDGDSTLVKTDLGTLILNGTNTYIGGTTIDGGTLQIGDGGTAGSIVGDVTDNGSLIFNRSDQLNYDGNVSGTGSLEHAGTGTLILTGTNTYTGATTVSAGTLQIGDGGTTGSLAGDVTNNTFYGSLIFNRSDDLSYGGVISGSGSVVKLGNGTLTMSGANTYTGGTAVKAGTLKIVSGAEMASGIVVGGAGQNASLQVDQGATVSGQVLLEAQGALDNAGHIATSATFVPAVGGYSDGAIVTNHDGGLIESDFSQPGSSFPAVSLGPNSTLLNASGSTIRGYTGVATEGTVNNAGGTIAGMADDAINGHATLVNNTDGGQITSGARAPFNLPISSGVKTLAANAVVNNLGGSTIAGRGFGTYFFDGGTVTNDGDSLISGNVAIHLGTMSSATGLVNNTGGSRINGTAAGIVLKQGGTVTNDAGATIEASATPSADCSVTLACSIFVPIHSPYGSYGSNGILDLTNAGTIIGNVQMDPTVANNTTLVTGGVIDGDLKIGPNAQSTLTLDGNAGTTQLYSNAVTGTTTFGGTLVKNGGGTWLIDSSDLQGVIETSVTAGSLQATQTLSGNVTVNASGNLDGVPGVTGDLSNAGKVAVHEGDSTVGGNYAQSSAGTLVINLGSKLGVTGTATLNGGTLEVTGADNGYVSNTHTNVLTAGAGVTGTFTQLVKGTGVVFTATTINYDANSVWLDTTGLDVTTAAAGQGVSYTAASMGSARRVQAAFEQLNGKIAAGNLAGVSGDFVRAAGQFQQAPTLQAAQASLQSLSGQLHAASVAMTFKAIDASNRALSDRFDNLLDKDNGLGMWMQNLNVGGNMARAGFDGVGFQLNGWLVGSDRRIGQSGVAGYAFGQSRGQQRLDQGFDRDNSRSTEGMMYAGWLNGNWYTQGRVGFGRFQQDVSRQLLLGNSMQGVRTRYDGKYDVAYGESGLRFGRGNRHVTPFVNVQYARIDRDGFVEQGAGGFGLRSNAQTVDRWQAGVGVRAGRHWNLDGGRVIDFSARAQWQRTLASHGDVFDASFVGMQQWQPLAGIGLSRYSGLIGVGLDATLSANTKLKFGYDSEMGQRDHAQMLSANLSMTF
jgi:fibronectin-binding autotransporter adhesin